MARRRRNPRQGVGGINPRVARQGMREAGRINRGEVPGSPPANGATVRGGVSPNLGGLVGGWPQQQTLPEEKDTTLFRSIIGNVLRNFGLYSDSLIEHLAGLYKGNMISDSPDILELTGHLYQRPEFQARFPSIAELWKKQQGDSSVYVPSVGEVIDYENTVRNALTSYGITGYDVKDTTTKLILGDVAATEAVTRIQLAAYAATTGPKEVAEALLAHEGMTYGDLIGFYLDPKRGQQEIERKHAVAQMQAWQKQAGLGQNWGFSEQVVAQGISNADAQSAFIRAAMRRNATGGYGETVTEQQTKTAELGMSAQDAQALSRVASSRQGLFAKGGGASEDKSGVAGLRKQ